MYLQIIYLALNNSPIIANIFINYKKKFGINYYKCNVMVTRPITWLQHMTTHMTTQMIYLHDLDTWPTKVNLTYESQAIIDSHICVTTTSTSWLHLDLLITAARVFSKSSTTAAYIFNKSRNLARVSSRALWGLQERLPSD